MSEQLEHEQVEGAVPVESGFEPELESELVAEIEVEADAATARTRRWMTWRTGLAALAAVVAVAVISLVVIDARSSDATRDATRGEVARYAEDVDPVYAEYRRLSMFSVSQRMDDDEYQAALEQVASDLSDLDPRGEDLRRANDTLIEAVELRIDAEQSSERMDDTASGLFTRSREALAEWAEQSRSIADRTGVDVEQYSWY